MKKVKSLIVLIAIIAVLFSFKKEPAKRYYYIPPRMYNIEIPENLINTFWLTVHGQAKKMSVEEYEKSYPELMQSIEGQVVSQVKEFAKQDSVFNLKNKDIKQDSIDNAKKKK